MNSTTLNNFTNNYTTTTSLQILTNDPINNNYPWYKSPIAVFIYVVIFLICQCGCPNSKSGRSNK